MYRLLASVALVAVTVRPVSGQEQGKDTTLAAARESRAAASAGLDTLRALAREHSAALGFEAGEAAGAVLGEPLVEFYVRLDSLRAFTSTTNPASLLSGGDKVMYPVMAGGKTRSSIEVDHGRGGWRPVAYGGQGLARNIVEQRERVAAADKKALANYFLVRVPSLGLVFIGVNSGGSLNLTPLQDDPAGRWKAGATMSAATAFGALVADARASKGLPT